MLPQIPGLRRAQTNGLWFGPRPPLDGKSVVSQKKKVQNETFPIEKVSSFINVCTYSFVYTYMLMCVQMNMVGGTYACV